MYPMGLCDCVVVQVCDAQVWLSLSRVVCGVDSTCDVELLVLIVRHHYIDFVMVDHAGFDY